jgi:hypothetical protein
MDSLLERIEENKLDALYLFINETLRDRAEFNRFLINLLHVLPHNWSIQRVEVGHEFLSMVENQDELFDPICNLESLRTLIISDGYVPRKDYGSVQTEALLTSLPRARNLINLDCHRLSLADKDQVDLLADVFEALQESLEEIRITGLSLHSKAPLLDRAIEACVDMGNLRSFAISTTATTHWPGTTTTTTTGNTGTATGTAAAAATATATATATTMRRKIMSNKCLLNLSQNSTTLQDLALRAMNVDDDTCRTIAKALTTNSFLTSLDLRQNEGIGEAGHGAILEALERNYDLWCTVMVVSMYSIVSYRIVSYCIL